MSVNDKKSEDLGDMADRSSKASEQIAESEAREPQRVKTDIGAFFADKRGEGGAQDLDAMADAAGRGEGAGEGKPPAGDVRTVYENERQPGEAKPRGGQQ